WLRLQRGIFLYQAQSLGQRSLQLRISMVVIILRRYIHINIWISTVVFHVPAHIFEPERIFGLRGHRIINKAVTGTDTYHTTPRSLPNQRPQTHQLKAMTEDIPIRSSLLVGKCHHWATRRLAWIWLRLPPTREVINQTTPR